LAGLPKQARLLTKADFNAVFSKSVKVSNPQFLLLIHINNNPYSRLGLVISKKVDKRAVQRNRIKRISRESFRMYDFQINCDFVILARPKITNLPNKELFDALNSLWKQAETKIKRIRNKK
jgi:ribonuclease P protein component